MQIHKDLTFAELLRDFPDAGPILAGYGLHCIGCHIGTGETIEQGVMAHGHDSAMLQTMLDDLNKNAIN